MTDRRANNGGENTTTSATYDALGEPTFATDALGAVTRTDYDIRGRVTQTIANCLNLTGCPTSTDPPDPNTQSVTTTESYDALDRVTAENVPLDLNHAQHTVTASFYDADGRVTRTVRNCVNGCPAGAASDTSTNVTTTTAYDAAGNATLSTDPAGNQTSTTFDALNRPVDVKRQSGGTTPTVVSDKQTGYDGAGNVVQTVVDPAGKNLITTYTFDAANRTQTMTEPPAVPNATDASGQATLTTYSYDPDGHVIQTLVTNQAVTTNPVGKTTVTYDALGRPQQKQENGGTSNGAVQLLTTTYVHDADGRTTSTTDPNGQTTTATRDQLGQVTVLSRPDGTDSASYDQAGHTIQTANSSGHTVYTYDALWRVIREQHYDASGTLISTTSHAYDASGHELAPVTTLANGTQTGLTYTYDALGRIQTMSDGSRSYMYGANGALSVMKVLNGTATAVEEDFGYDAGNRPAGLTDKVGPAGTQLHAYSFTYDVRGNAAQLVTDGASTAYTYDNLDQMLSVTDGTGTTTFTYDANHNRKTMVATVAGTSYTTSYTYDAQADQELLSKTDPSNKTTVYTYDNAGNLTQAIYDPTTLDPGGANQVTQYAYDTSGRLTTVTEPNGTTVAFTYDADGNRASKTVTTGGPAPTVTTVRDVYQAGRIAYQTDGSGTTLATFAYDASGVPSSVQVGSDPSTAPRYYYIYNPHGDVVALVDASGNTVATYSYDAFGGVTASESLPGGWSNPYRYDGRDRVRYDPETSLYWMSVRAYDPTLGRFISRDPLNRTPLAWANQPYVFGANNPVRNVDPSGQGVVDLGNPFGQSVIPTKRQSAIQTAPPAPCDATCQADQAREAHRESYRDKKIGDLEGQLKWLRIAKDLAYSVADGLKIYLHITKERIWDAVLDTIDFSTQVSGLFSDVGALIGGDLEHTLNDASAAMQLLWGTMMFVRGILSMPFVGELVRNALNTVLAVALPGVMGPMGIVIGVVESTVGGAISDLISAGGHALDYIVQVKEEDVRMYEASMDYFCQQDGGCPTA